MRALISRLRDDERGVIISSEIVLVGTILVIGALVGLAAVSYAVNQELNDVANAVSAGPPLGFQTVANDLRSGAGPLTGSNAQIEVVGH